MTTMQLTMNTTKGSFRAFGRVLIAIWIGILALGESAGRARAAAELHRMGYYDEAKALMLQKDSKDV
jgi:hypothetical protein